MPGEHSMPVLEDRGVTPSPLPGALRLALPRAVRGMATNLFPACANAACSSGWLRLWRGRQAPVFEGGWTCGPECMRAMVGSAVTRELEGRDEQPTIHSHRVPLGLVLLAQGGITSQQLKSVLEAQRS